MEKHLKWYANLFDIYAPAYDLIGRRFMPARKAAIRELGITQGMQVLLAGCGTGLDLEFVPQGGTFWLADVSTGMLKQAAKRASKLGLNAQTVQADISRMPVLDQHFDIIILHFTLTLQPQSQTIWTEFDRILKSGGTVSVFDWFGPTRLPAWVVRMTSFTGWPQGVLPEQVLPTTGQWKVFCSDTRAMTRRFVIQKIN